MNIDSKRVEVLKSLLESEGRSISELSEASGVSQPTVSRIVNEFEDEGLVYSSKKGNMKLVDVRKRDFVKDLVSSLTGVKQLEDAALDFADAIKDLDVKMAAVFGSVARGTAERDSDVDVLVLVEEDSEDLREKIMLNADKLTEDTGFQVSPTVMSIGKFEEHRKTGSQFYKSIKQDLKVLFDDRSS